MEEDAQILATILKHTSCCMNADDIEQLLQDIPVQPPVVVPVRTVQEAVLSVLPLQRLETFDLWM
jgi:hypothetical protein